MMDYLKFETSKRAQTYYYVSMISGRVDHLINLLKYDSINTNERSI